MISPLFETAIRLCLRCSISSNVFSAQLFLCAFLIIAPVDVISSTQVSKNQSFKHPKTNVVIVGGELILPGKGVWMVDDQFNSVLKDIFLIAPEIIHKRGLGISELKRMQERGRRRENTNLNQIYYALERYAKKK